MRRDTPGKRGVGRRRAALLAALALGASGLAAEPLSKVHDSVQTRADCTQAARGALGTQALVFTDPPRAATPHAGDLGGEFWWPAQLVSPRGERLLPVWLHCEIVPGATATYAEIVTRSVDVP